MGHRIKIKVIDFLISFSFIFKQYKMLTFVYYGKTRLLVTPELI